MGWGGVGGLKTGPREWGEVSTSGEGPDVTPLWRASAY